MMPRTVRSKLFVTMGTVIGAFVLMSLLVVAHVADEFGEEEIGRNMQFARDAFEGYLRARQQLLQDKGRALADAPYLKATLSIQELDRETAYYSAKELAEVGQSDLLLLIDYHGNLLADAASLELGGESMLRQPLISQAIEGEEGSAVWSYRGETFLATVTPVATVDTLLGVLVLGQKVDQDFAAQVREATGRDVLMFHQSQRLAQSYAGLSADSDGDLSTDAAESILENVLAVLGREDEVVRLEDNGETRLYSSIRVGDLRILLSRSLDDFAGLSARASLLLMSVGSGILLVAFVICLAISRRLSQPIADLVAASERLADGHLSTQVAVDGDDELSTLSSSFNTMAGRIETLVRDVQAAADVAREASQAKTNFLANISHELRTPLNGIIGFTGLLLEKVENQTAESDQGDSADWREWLKTIDDSSRQLLLVVEQVLDAARIEDGQLDVHCAPCNPWAIVDDACQELRPLAEEKGLQLELKTTNTLPEVVSSDESRLRQLVTNLVDNAIKFTRSGNVSVEMSLVRQGETSRLRIVVSDTGIGIPAERLSAVFEPFVQADGSMTREFGGVGLGLSISRQIAVALGGNITATSEPGRGSTFVCEVDAGVQLPDSPTCDRDPQTSSAESPQAGIPADASWLDSAVQSKRILVVDDGDPNRRLVSLVLRKAGAQVEEAANGKEALDRFSMQSFDLVLMDMQMPVLDGYDATRELRRRGVTIPIVALTAHAMEGDREKCLSAGCSGYLTKPISPQELVYAVSATLVAEKATPETC